MSGITSGVGIFSGIDTSSIISQLLQISSRPRQLAERRLAQLQVQQSAYLDLNSRLSSLRSAASAFRTENIFDTKQASSNNEDVLTASASPFAQEGSYSFIVDRLVSTQQQLSRGFADRNSSALGATSFSFESPEARLDRNTDLSLLNNGNGIDRGTIIIDGTEVDLSRVGTVQEVIEEINNTVGPGVTASVEGGRFVIDGATSITSKTGDTTAETLGIANKTPVSGVITGDAVYGINATTALDSLNDGRGVLIDGAFNVDRYDFEIGLDGLDAIRINIGAVFELDEGDEPGPEDDRFEEVQGASSSVGQVVDRINAALQEAAAADPEYGDLSATFDVEEGRIRLVNSSGLEVTVTERDADSQTAADLGILGSSTGDLAGQRVLAGLNTTLIGSINGGSGLGGGSALDFDLRDGGSFSVDLSSAETLDDVIRLINNDATNAGRLRVSLDDVGTGLVVNDISGGGGNLTISGDAAASLGIETDPGGVAASSVSGTNLELAYLGRATRLEDLDTSIGTGRFEITDSNGNIAEIIIDDNVKTLGDVIDKINGRGSINVIARINQTGDGIEIIEDPDQPDGALEIKISDTTGRVAERLGIEGEASGTGDDNVISGSFERTVEFEATDTLDDMVSKINDAGAGVSASIINDGTAASPFRISLISRTSGVDGRFILDTNGFDLGLATLDPGSNSRVFFGSTNAADGVLLTSSSNTVDGVLNGVSIDLTSTSDEPVTLSITSDTESIETRISSFVDAFNTVLERIDTQTRYVQETNERGPLLGDGTAITLRQRLSSTAISAVEGFTNGFNRLLDVGISVGDGGTLEFDTDRFRQALQDDPESVEALFTRRTLDPDGGVTDLGNGITVRDPLAEDEFTELGVVAQLERLANEYINSVNGVFTTRNDSIESQIGLQRDRISRFTQQLESERLKLQTQFIAMEQTIAQLQQQGSALSGLGFAG